MPEIFGADIGNGFCYISLADDSKKPVSVMPEEFKNSGMPSMAYIDNDGSILLRNIRNKIAKHPERGVTAVKTRLDEEKVTVNGVTYSPAEVYAAVVREAVSAANKTLSISNRSPVYELVLAYPSAYHDDPKLIGRLRQAVESVSVDGHKLEVKGMIPEPAAVALDYLHYMRYEADEEIRIKDKETTVLVYDLGHGSFDTAIVRAKDVDENSDEEPYEVLPMKGGIPKCGGHNFNEIIRDMYVDTLIDEHEYTPNDFNKSRLYTLAESAKHELSDSEESTQIYVLPNGTAVEFSVTRDEFYENSEHLIDETIEETEKLIAYAKENNITVDSILLSGGASQMPAIKSRIEEVFPEFKDKVLLYKPHTAVSFGAARYAADIKVAQFTNKQYGYRNPQGDVTILIDANAKLPYKSKPVTVLPASSHFKLWIYVPENIHSNTGEFPFDVPFNDCRNLVILSFDGVTPNEPCEITLTVTEEFGIIAECTMKSGKIVRRSTFNCE